jgi:hypothetical protein
MSRGCSRRVLRFSISALAGTALIGRSAAALPDGAEAEVRVGARAGWGFHHIATLMASLEGQGDVLEWLAIGGQLGAFVVDAGADPQYCGCVIRGQFVVAYGELGLSRPWTVSPFLRLGPGLANTERYLDDGRMLTGLGPAFYGEAGVGLEIWYVYSRLGGSLLVARDAIPGVSLTLGARF